MRKKFLLLALFLTFILSVFCSCFSFKDDETNKVTLEVGQTYDFYYEENANYFSSDNQIATVDDNGLVQAKSVGKCIITASKSANIKKLNVTVVEKSVPTPDYFVEIKIGETYTFNAQTSSVSDNENVAVMDLQGVITGVGVGVCRITFEQNGVQKIIQVTVTEKVIPTQAYFSLDCDGGRITDEKWIDCGNGKYYVEENATLPVPVKEGYNFVGWYSGEEEIKEVLQGGSAKAKWNLIKFKINYELNGGQNNPLNVSEYGYFQTEPITLYSPSLSGKVFVGWFTNAEFTEKVTQILPSKTDITLYAYFSDYYEVTYKYNSPKNDGVIKVAVGEKLSIPAVYAENGYFIEWFIDEACTVSYNFYDKVENSFTIYGKKFKEVSDGFFGFNDYKPDGVMDSEEEFVRYLDYIYFNQIETDVFVQMNYGEYDNYTKERLTEVLRSSTMPFESLSYATKTVNGKNYIAVSVTKKFPETLKTYTPTSYPQQIYDIEFSKLDGFVSERSDNFDDFKYNKLEKTVSVENTNQLFYALEHRVKPIPVKNSGAEIALEKCKAILRKICDDTLTDVEKAKNIYTFLVKNVDYVLPIYNNSSDAMDYDAFYMEGILNNGAGVCDGISKTFSCLMNMEGIRCVRTTSLDHAWNEAFINGKWFTIDATHGNVSTSNDYELLAYNNFMINETIKESYGYSDGLRTEIIADGVYDYYANSYFTYNGTTYDYNIGSVEELSYLFRVAKQTASENSQTTFSVNFVLDYDSGTNYSSIVSSAKIKAGMLLTEVNVYSIQGTGRANLIVVFN